MSKLFFLSCTVLGLIFTLAANTRQEDKSDAVSKHVVILRQLGTEEYNYRERYGRFCDREQLLAYLHKSGATKAVDRLEHLQSFQLSVITSSDGAHYQISLTPLLDDANRGGWCDKAGFADDRGVIFLGAALNCEGTAKY
jgi:hypothetical protein